MFFPVLIIFDSFDYFLIFCVMVIFFLFSIYNNIFMLLIDFMFQRLLVTMSFFLSLPLHAITTCHWLSKTKTRQGMPSFNPISK